MEDETIELRNFRNRFTVMSDARVCHAASSLRGIHARATRPNQEFRFTHETRSGRGGAQAYTTRYGKRTDQVPCARISMREIRTTYFLIRPRSPSQAQDHLNFVNRA